MNDLEPTYQELLETEVTRLTDELTQVKLERDLAQIEISRLRGYLIEIEKIPDRGFMVKRFAESALNYGPETWGALALVLDNPVSGKCQQISDNSMQSGTE